MLSFDLFFLQCLISFTYINVFKTFSYYRIECVSTFSYKNPIINELSYTLNLGIPTPRPVDRISMNIVWYGTALNERWLILLLLDDSIT